MTLFPTVFKMQKLKRLFYYFLATLVLLTVLSVTMVGLIDKSDLALMKGFSNSWALFIFLFIIAFAQGQISKKELVNLRKFTDAEGLFDKYTQFYKKRLFLNCIPVMVSAVLFVLTFKNLFFYLLFIQIIFSFAFFPREGQILKELPDRDIIFD